MKAHHYYLYIITNKRRNVLYIGMTNNLLKRIDDHYCEKIPGFSQSYKCKYLIYYEHYEDVYLAISREKTLKKWRRDKKEKLEDSYIDLLNENLIINRLIISASHRLKTWQK